MKTPEQLPVSIITPCYNKENTLPRFLDSLLAQTYPAIELILVNDGSTDRTAAVIAAYRDRLQRGGIRLIYLEQENQGVSAAINTGLAHFTGAYLTWPDADDWLRPESLSRRVAVLNAHPEAGVVTSDADLVLAGAEASPVGRISRFYPHTAERRQFFHCLNEDTIYIPGCHLVRRSAFLAAHPDRTIYPGRLGQNYQLLLPLYYTAERIFLNEPLFVYLISPDSHSRGFDTYEKCLARANGYEVILTETLKKIPLSPVERAHYQQFVTAKYARKRLSLAVKFRRREPLKTERKLLQLLNCYNSRDRIKYLIGRFRPLGALYHRLLRPLVVAGRARGLKGMEL